MQASAPQRRKLEVAKSEFQKMIQEGTSRQSSSNWASPLQMLPKPDKTWRLCDDYRLLNSNTTPDNYSVHHVEDFAVGLSGNKIFSKSNLKKAFHRIPIKVGDVKKTAIITSFGLFDYLVMPVGLKNAAQTSQRFISEFTHGLEFVYSYFDDLLVASPNESTHIEHLTQLLARLSDFGLKVIIKSANLVKSSLGLLSW